MKSFLSLQLSHVNEGGVAAGLGALDSVFLVDTDWADSFNDTSHEDIVPKQF